MNAPSGSSRWNLPQRNYSHWAILLWKLHDRILGGNFDTVPASDGRTDEQMGSNCPSPKILCLLCPQNSLTPNLWLSTCKICWRTVKIYFTFKSRNMPESVCSFATINAIPYTVGYPFWNEVPRPLICIFHLCPPLNLFNMTQSLSMLTFMLSSKSAQFLWYMDLRTPTIRLDCLTDG